MIVVGSLRDQYQSVLREETVILHCRYGSNSTWTTTSSNRTDSLGRYTISWTPIAPGNYVLEVEWAGNATHMAANNIANLNVNPSLTANSVPWYMYLGVSVVIMAIVFTLGIFLRKRS
jgi:hypothetical protein